jgi:uncharacterized membrane protein
VLAEFEKILPGLADRIMRMAEKQSVHRQHLERITVEGDNRRSWAGLRAGLAVGLAAIAGTVLLGIFGSPVAASILGSVLGGGTIVGLVSVFVVGKKGRETEREKKAELMTGGKLPSAKQPLPVPATPPHPASPSTQD